LNLRWAWEKVRRASTPGDAWINEIELAEFELELESNLKSIAEEMKQGRYKLRPLKPMAFPKNPSKDGKQQVRQYFNVAVRDQVAWTAVVNIIGPFLDQKMPTWSYGNRLFRSIWTESDEKGVRRQKIGRYRDSSGQIYLPFLQSWPRFRRHVFLSTLAMTGQTGKYSTTKEDVEELECQESLPEKYKCPFIQKKHWAIKRPREGKKKLFWCSLDLEKFYPSLKLDIILRNITEFLPAELRVDADNLIESMMLFEVDTANWSTDDLEALNEIGLSAKERDFKGIPTGLYVAGFLANAGLFKVDLEVDKLLKNRNVAHFRFVDDHIVLAYSFNELVKWVEEYLKLLDSLETGATVNRDKIEPEALAQYFGAKENPEKSLDDIQKEAEKKCELNPQFPTPLMTKTLALVSAIARTDFDLLEESEIVSLTDQLEHMLLVELPEAEIPEKTRLSFAATRLIRLAECRLSNNARLVELECRHEILDAELANKALSNEHRVSFNRERKETKKELKKQRDKLDREVFKAFGLMRKVLQERPDRVRLWTRAIKMCRQAGVKGLKDIFNDITRVKDTNPMAAEYLYASTLSLLGYEAIIAALLVLNPEIAEWRKKAAQSFLNDIKEAPRSNPLCSGRRWFLQKSWEQFCFGVFCADVIIRSSSTEEKGYESGLPAELIKAGSNCLTEKGIESSQSMAWWAARLSMREFSSRAPRWVVDIACRIPATSESNLFWRFFPFDVPPDILQGMIVDDRYSQNLDQMGGWWYDALSAKREIASTLMLNGSSPEIACALNNLQSTSNRDFVSLHEWCAEIRQIRAKNASDPRASEWTALEIVRQVGLSITEFNLGYVAKQSANHTSTLCLHPANFRVPRKWLDDFKLKSPTWIKWENKIKPENNETQVKYVSDDLYDDLSVADSRYTPLQENVLSNDLFVLVNPVRGLGLLLYGLLRHDFEFPTVWNGPGHSDVLNRLPLCLLKEMTCSSLTLGLLKACLQPRAMENLKPSIVQSPDDDSLHDPVLLRNVEDVCQRINQCQEHLKRNRLSTINDKPRQLTPISIRDLSNPEWSKAFKDVQEGESVDEQ